MCEGARTAVCGGAAAHDVDVVTTGGRKKIPAHSSVLASASPVLACIIERRQQDRESGKIGGRTVVRIRGVSDDAAAAFVRVLYAGSRCGELGGGAEEDSDEDMDKYAVQVLVLAHAYQVAWLKRCCEVSIGARLTADSVVDVLQLAGLCDAPRLRLRCTRLLAKEFKAVEKTEAWRFLQENDPWQELDILQRLHDADLRRRRWRRKRAEQRVYMELSEAMDCLLHICTEGCTEVGPAGQAPAAKPCRRYATCRGLQLLIRHFSQCHRKSCARCQRMWQLLRLHSALCDRPDQCNTPLCTRFKTKEQEKADDDDDKWGLLVKKVKAASVFSSLATRKQMTSSTLC
ncbi:hypothetical protein PR202_ga08570 [Eleusine coracana subsp. coracana]|uniref:BTB domain-containing protein n=1 Tax=Eleusine coracana subsp. coracana TaxID=191504 RepID=A0AAV5C0X0_ELECO|nr:hypothetical protein QOZ80_1BG0093750 [Eleusine coracana subsp. coracana]GJM92136.1 hypothetical protein PR202_ga08570 [Eleusine coracana subsp. coracana]